MDDPKATLHHYLRQAREALLWKLEGLGEYDVRRPLVPTGTNLLGLVKHSAAVEAGYFGEVFGRPFPEPMSWFQEGADPNADMWATAEEAVDEITALSRRASAHADATIAALPATAPGQVPHWPAERRDVTLHGILVHVVAETNRHAGHADILRELIDGGIGVRREAPSVLPADAVYWLSYREHVEQAARTAAGMDRS